MELAVVHHVPGRLRIRIPDLKIYPKLAQWLRGPVLAQPGVESLRINTACASAVIHYDRRIPRAAEGLLAALDIFSPHCRRETMASQAESPSLLRRASSAIMRWMHRAGTFFWSSMALGGTLAGGLLGAAALPLVCAAAFPSLRRAWRVLRGERRLNVDFLDSVAMIVSVGRGRWFTAAFIAWMIQLGDWIREKTAARSKRIVGKLLEFQTTTAWVIREGKVVRVPASTIQPGETLIVYPGEIIPADGTVIGGRATVDQKSITGESLPAERGPGEDVYASTVLRDGKLSVRAMRVGADTTAAQIVELIEAAPIGETRMQNYAEHFGDRLVAPSLALTSALFAATQNVDRLLSMLIVDFGTGMRVAAPTAVLAAIAHAARHGILIKSGRHMERLAEIDTIVFDKTGTLTHGVPEIRAIISCDERFFPSRKILALAAGAEARLKHPVSQALVARALADAVEIPERSGGEFEIGLGVEAQINGYRVHVGSEHFFSRKKIRMEPVARAVQDAHEKGCSTLFFAVDGVLKGVIPYADRVRQESGPVVRALRHAGVKNVVMITGDHTRVARAVAGELGIDCCFAEILPASKAEIVRSLQSEGRVVGMVGDGINDSPALAHADVGIAMKHGADVARETADVVLMEDNLWKLVSAVEISRQAMRTIRQNYAIIAGLNALALLLAIPQGLIHPNVAALVSNGSAILASLNSIRPVLGG
jgi:heavy metal translocating P-type ATPase